MSNCMFVIYPKIFYTHLLLSKYQWSSTHRVVSQNCWNVTRKRTKFSPFIFSIKLFPPWKDIFEVKIPFSFNVSFVKKCSYISFTIISNFKGDELIKNRISRSLINIDLKRNIASLKIYRSLNFTLISVTDEFSSWLVRIDHLSSMYVCKVYLHLCISMHW